MAIMDYGALLRVDGEFVNKNTDLFMEASDTGYICEEAEYPNGNKEQIVGNYFVLAGDEEFLIVFYKGILKMISNGKIIGCKYWFPFNSETFYTEGFPNIKVSRVSKRFEYKPYESLGTWKEYVKEYWIGATGNEKLSELTDGHKHYKRFMKNLKARAREKGYKTRPFRFLAEWEYGGRKYEVIFGYGIDPVKHVWDVIKYGGYGFREDEIVLIDDWFNEE